MWVNILLREGPLFPLRTVPIDAVIVDIGAIHVANVLRRKPVQRQLWPVGSPSTVRRIIISQRANQAIEALVDPRLNHQICRECAHFVVQAGAVSLRVHHIWAQQDVERGELERIHVHSQCDLDETKVHSEFEATKHLEDELRVGWEKRILVNSIEE